MAFDFKKEYKEFYMPKNKPEIVTVPKANYIAVRGMLDVVCFSLTLFRKVTLVLLRLLRSSISERDSSFLHTLHGGLDRLSQEPLQTRQEQFVYQYTW